MHDYYLYDGVISNADTSMATTLMSPVGKVIMFMVVKGMVGMYLSVCIVHRLYMYPCRAHSCNDCGLYMLIS